MRRKNQQNKVGEKIIVKCKKNTNHDLELMGTFPIPQMNNNGTVRFQRESSMIPPIFAE